MVEVEGTPLNIPGNKDKEKKRNRKQKQKSSGENPIVAFFTDKRFRIVFGTILMLSAIFQTDRLQSCWLIPEEP